MERQPQQPNDEAEQARLTAASGKHLEPTPDMPLLPPEDKPRIWVGSLSDYNNGILFGQWIDADREPDEIWQDIQDLLARSPTPGAEEWGIFDYENFGGVPIHEYDPIEAVSALALGIRQHGLAFAGWAGIHEDNSRANETFEDAFLGHWDSLEDFAANMLDDCGLQDVIDQHVPEGMRHYVQIDVEGFARDLEMGGDIVVADAPDGGIWIYDGHV